HTRITTLSLHDALPIFFEGNYHRPNAENPVVFRLIKKLDPEPLVARHVSHDLAYDGRSYYYDLRRGTLTPQPPTEAGLKFSFERDRKSTRLNSSHEWIS